MAAKETSVGRIIGKILLGVLALFTLFVPLFYLDARLARAGIVLPLWFIFRVLRYSAAAGLGLWLRKKHRAALCAQDRARLIALFAVILCAMLLTWHGDSLYAYYIGFGDRLGLLYPKPGPVLPSVLWETFASGDLLWALVLCAAVVFIHNPFRSNSKKIAE